MHTRDSGKGWRACRQGLVAVGALAWLPAWGTEISATPEAGGRWEGQVQIPGEPLRLVVDLQADAQGRWQGSVVLQGREYVTVGASSADFRIEGRFDGERGTLEGAMSQGPFEID